MSERDASIVFVAPLSVRPAMAQELRHARRRLALRWSAKLDDAAESAHQAVQASMSAGRCASALKRLSASDRARLRRAATRSGLEASSVNTRPRAEGML